MPNTKIKKFDWQIFLAVFCILLVISCATICCVVGNTEKGVAHADESVTNLTNLTFETSDNFYIKNLTGVSTQELERYINYFTYGIEGVLSDSVDFSYRLQVGTYALTYNTSSTLLGNLYFEINQISSYGLFSMSCYIQSSSGTRGMFDILYMYTSNPQTFTFSTFESSSNDESKYTYNVPSLNTLNWFVVFGISVNSVNSIKFNFNYTTNLGCMISPNDTYATIPTPEYDLGYNDGYQNGYGDAVSDIQPQIDELRQQIDELNAELQEVSRERDEYYTYFEAIGWFSILQSNLNNISLLDLGTYKSTDKNIQVNNGYNHIVVTSFIDAGSSCAFGIVLPRYYGNGTRMRFAYNSIAGNVNGMTGPMVCRLGYLNSSGTLVDIMELPFSTEGFIEFNIAEDTNTLVVYTYGNVIELVSFEVLVFSFDEVTIYDTAYNEGFDNGKSQGLQLGRQEGYNQGVLDANDYSFFGLFTAIFDAPITSIVGKWGDTDGDGVYEREGGMLNFYIPGLDINFAPFLLSLFTIAIIVLIIRFILARKS